MVVMYAAQRFDESNQGPPFQQTLLLTLDREASEQVFSSQLR